MIYQREIDAINAKYPLVGLTRQQIIQAEKKRQEELSKLNAKRGIRYQGGFVE